MSLAPLTKKVRLGIIGCGGMAGTHKEGFDELSERMEITATCDIILERAQLAAEQTGATVAVTDYQELLDSVDAVLIVLPHDLHFEVGKACLEAGKHVLMEKPMCNTEEECLELIRIAEQADRILMTAYPVRFFPAVRKLKELLDAKTYGECFQISIWTEQYTRFEDGHWTESAARLGGGQFFSHGCHYIDLLLWLLGRPVRGVHMGTRLATPWLEKEGTSNVTIEFESGALGYHFGTWGARGTRLGWSIHAHCTEGMIEIHLGEEKMVVHTNLQKETSSLEFESDAAVLMDLGMASKFTHFEIGHFLDCIASGQRPMTDGPASLQGLRVIWRLYEAEHKQAYADLAGLGLDQDWRAIRA